MSYTATPGGARSQTLDRRPADSGAATARSRTGRVGRAILVIALIAVAGRVLFTVDAPRDVLQLPEEGAVRAAALADGTRVFLVHQDDGTATVVEALTPEGPGPIEAMVGWCPIAEQFVDPHHGRLYDARGRRSPVSVPGRLADRALHNPTPDPSDDLNRRSFERLDGRDGAEDPILVDASLTAGQVAADPLDRPADARDTGPPPVCLVEPRPMVPTVDAFAAAAGSRLLDHGFQSALLRLPRSGWQITDGFLAVDGDGSTTWCRVEPVGVPPACPDIAPIRISLPITAEQAGGTWTVVGGPLAVLSDDGAVARVAVLPSSVWRGGSLQGTHTYIGRLAALEPTRDRIWLEPFPSEGSTDCLRPVAPSPGLNGTPAGIQAVDADTEFEVAALTDPAEIARIDLPLSDRPQVEVLVDTATCRALRVSDR